MSEAMHPAAPHYIPWFIAGPGETDVLLTGSAIFLVVAVLGLGSAYFWLHALPERISHGASQHQFQLVAVLSLLALFTHINAFWVAALLLALIPVPDFWTPLASMADSLARMATGRPRSPVAEAPSEQAPEVVNYPLPVRVEIARPPEPKETAGNGPLDEAAKAHAPASSEHQLQAVSTGGPER